MLHTETSHPYLNNLYVTDATPNFLFFSLLSSVTCMTSTTISTCWPMSCSTSAQPLTQSSTTWCLLPTARSSSPRCVTSSCPTVIRPVGNHTLWPGSQSASPATTPCPPTLSKKRHTEQATKNTLSFPHTINPSTATLWLLVQLMCYRGDHQCRGKTSAHSESTVTSDAHILISLCLVSSRSIAWRMMWC